MSTADFKMVLPDERLKDGEPCNQSARTGWWPPSTPVEAMRNQRKSYTHRCERSHAEAGRAMNMAGAAVRSAERRLAKRIGPELAQMTCTDIARSMGVAKQRVSQMDIRARQSLIDGVGGSIEYTGPAAMWAVVASEQLVIVKAEGVLDAIAAAVVEFGEVHSTLTARRMNADEVIAEGREGGFAAAYAAREGDVVLVEDQVRSWK